MKIKTCKFVYIVMIQNPSDEEAYTNIVGVFETYERALEAKQRLEPISRWDDLITITSMPYDSFLFVTQEEERARAEEQEFAED